MLKMSEVDEIVDSSLHYTGSPPRAIGGGTGGLLISRAGTADTQEVVLNEYTYI